MSFGYRKPRWSPPTISPDDDSASSSSHPSDPSEVTSNADMSDETKGPQTDYGSSMVKWMKNRRMGKTKIEQERPSPSYIIDVSATVLTLPPPTRLHHYRCCHLLPTRCVRETRFLANICTPRSTRSNTRSMSYVGRLTVDASSLAQQAASSRYGTAWASTLRPSCR